LIEQVAPERFEQARLVRQEFINTLGQQPAIFSGHRDSVRVFVTERALRENNTYKREQWGLV
jgi:hypothetical protein